jgi:hypothetical protein
MQGVKLGTKRGKYKPPKKYNRRPERIATLETRELKMFLAKWRISNYFIAQRIGITKQKFHRKLFMDCTEFSKEEYVKIRDVLIELNSDVAWMVNSILEKNIRHSF